MSPEAAGRVLYAEVQNNGVTGFVAATGKSYLCPDTANDPLYIEGAPGARSSLTVPLLFADQVVGTFNVESPEPNAFTEEDLQFTVPPRRYGQKWTRVLDSASGVAEPEDDSGNPVKPGDTITLTNHSLQLLRRG